MSPNPYRSPHVPSSEDTSPVAPRGIFRVAFPLAAAVPGAWAGMEYYLPPPGEGCGLAVIPAIFFGAPAGAVVFSVAGHFLGRLLDRAISR